MRVVISGAGGPIGTALTRLLRRRGDDVVRLTRGDLGTDAITWDPDNQRIDTAGLEGADAVDTPRRRADIAAPDQWEARSCAAEQVGGHPAVGLHIGRVGQQACCDGECIGHRLLR